VNLDDALNYLKENPSDTIPVAGGTDLLPRIRSKKMPARKLLDLSGIMDLRYVKEEQGVIKIGALTTIADLEKQRDSSASTKLLRQVAERFGSPNIRSVATVGGNVCAASSSEDLIPAFLVLNANVKIIRKDGTRELPFRDFLISKRKNALNGDEILAEVSFTEPRAGTACSFQKLGMRNILIIALVSVATLLEVDLADRRISSVRIALNRLRGKIPERTEGVEKWLLGQDLDQKTVEKATHVLGEELRLTSDFRASAEYRCEAAKVLLRRALTQCREDLLGK